jgi:hypothetical protein
VRLGFLKCALRRGSGDLLADQLVPPFNHIVFIRDEEGNRTSLILFWALSTS